MLCIIHIVSDYKRLHLNNRAIMKIIIPTRDNRRVYTQAFIVKSLKKAKGSAYKRARRAYKNCY